MSQKTIHDPPETVILEEGIEVQQTKAYGVGIDTHSKFIQVSVYVRRDMKCFEYRREFSTRWNDLVLAKQWILKVIQTCSDPIPGLTEAPFHYCIESTSTYHFPILLAWEGSPSIINPTIAGSTKRKTDVLDAKLLALHDLTSVWPSSYLPSRDVRELRVLSLNGTVMSMKQPQHQTALITSSYSSALPLAAKAVSPKTRAYVPLSKTRYRTTRISTGNCVHTAFLTW